MLQVSKARIWGNITSSLGNCNLTETPNFDFYKLQTLNSGIFLLTCLTLCLRHHKASAYGCPQRLTAGGSFHKKLSNLGSLLFSTQVYPGGEDLPDQGCTRVSPTAATGNGI